jgi:putative membrane protein
VVQADLSRLVTTMKLLTDDDKKAISAAIEKAEKGTSGEIVFAVSDTSDRYPDASIQGALAGTAVATAVYLALPVPHEIGLLLWTQLISFAFFYAVFLRLPWRRWFVPGRISEARVRDAALMEFFSSGLYNTRESNGVLVYLSLFERRVVVLGDKGIHEKMGAERWDQVRNLIIDGIRSGRAREGVIAAVEACGKTLAEHFPFRSDDTNELSNVVIDRRPK